MITTLDYQNKIRQYIAEQREALKGVYRVQCVHVFSGGTKSTVDDFANLGRTVNEHLADLVDDKSLAVLTVEKRVPNDISRGRDFEYDGQTINPQDFVSGFLPPEVRNKIDYIAAPNRYVPEVGHVGVLIVRQK